MGRPDRPLIGNAAALGIALVVAVFVIVAAPDPVGDGTATTTAPPAPHPTISLDDLTADLSAALEEEPDARTVDVVGPDGEVVTVVIPPSTTTTSTTRPPPPTTTTTTTSTTTTTTVPRPPVNPGDVADSIIDQLLGQGLPVPTTIPEEATGGTP